VADRSLRRGPTKGRVRSEAAFAKLGGVAAIEASSLMVTRYRLNRFGDRQLNRALHTIIMDRMREDADTRAYVQGRIAEGQERPRDQTILEALRRPPTPPPPPSCVDPST
jgi:hypothetical protein